MKKLKTFQIKAVESEKSDVHFEGYASTFGNTDRYGDVMVKGCFDETVKKKSVIPMLFNHETNLVIGKLELSTDDKGLFAKGLFNLNDPQAQNVYDLLKMGALNSMSIGFITKDYEVIDTKKPYSGWNIKEAEVVETSVVTVPANEQALITNVKSFFTDENEMKNFVSSEIHKALENQKNQEEKRNQILKQLEEIQK